VFTTQKPAQNGVKSGPLGVTKKVEMSTLVGYIFFAIV